MAIEIVSFPIDSMVIFHSYDVSLPEGSFRYFSCDVGVCRFHEVTHAVKGLADQMDVLKACRSGRCPSNKKQKQLLQYITIQQYCNIL